MMKKKRILIMGALFVAFLTIAVILNKEDGIEINETNFPEEILREIAMEADRNQSGILSEKEANAVESIDIKKFYPQDAADILEQEELPEYTNEDFVFDFEGIQHFSKATELKIDLADGESFNSESEEEIYVKTSNIDKIYELTQVEKFCLCEVGLEEIDVQKFANLNKLELNDMYNMEELIFPEHDKIKVVWITNTENLTKVDFSCLTNLKDVYVRDNANINLIQFGENNKTVEEISMWNLPELDTIDFSSLSELQTLELIDVAVNELDVSDNDKLNIVYLGGLNLETIDFSNNKELSEIVMDRDTSKEIKVADDNQITRVRYNNSDRKDFPFENLNPETLILIDILGTQIETLDISEYTNLETLYYDEEVTRIVGGDDDT